MDPREFVRSDAYKLLPLSELEAANSMQEVTISLTLSIRDAAALWHAAAAKAMAVPGMRAEDVIDVLGPREDPSIRDCIAMLTAPAAIPGCDLEDFRID